ncbi:MAG: hypothetical protein ACRDFB_00245, partial [Rhabdochlamydiaceae bacterium]
MTKTSLEKKYNWDIAISLCKQDIDFAKKLVKAINPSLKVFFYEDSQEKLISKSGPVAFAKTFKDESRVVVILSRDEWSNSYYTEIERNAIIDRTAVKNEGYQFLMIIPMVQGETPPWYPSTQIYASPFRFSVEELAHFIEFKIAEEGGVIKTLTVEDRYQYLIDRIEEKKSIINLQHDKASIQSAREEMTILKDCFNKKSEFLRKSIVDEVLWKEFNENVNASYFGYGDYLLECKFILPDEMYNHIVTTQDFQVAFELYKTFGSDTNRKSLEVEQRVFYYTSELQSWA